MAPATELERFVRSADGSLRSGRTLPGRGAWLCAGSSECLDAAIKRRAFTRSFRGPVDHAEVTRLRAEPAGNAHPDN